MKHCKLSRLTLMHCPFWHHIGECIFVPLSRNTGQQVQKLAHIWGCHMHLEFYRKSGFNVQTYHYSRVILVVKLALWKITISMLGDWMWECRGYLMTSLCDEQELAAELERPKKERLIGQCRRHGAFNPWSASFFTLKQILKWFFHFLYLWHSTVTAEVSKYQPHSMWNYMVKRQQFSYYMFLLNLAISKYSYHCD